MKLGIIGAMDQEITMLREALGSAETYEKAGFRYDSGFLEGVQTVLLLSGIGKVNAALGTSLMLNHYQPDLIVNTGSAGGMDPSMAVGDLVISTALRYHDADVTAFGYEPGQIPGLPSSFPADPDLQERAGAAVRQATGCQARSAEILSGDTFMTNPERIDRIRRLFPGAAALEMEGAAVAHTAHRYGVPFVVIRALSDIAGRESKQSFDEFLELASRQSAQVVQLLARSYRSGAAS